MMISFSRMQSLAGCTISQTINGFLSTPISSNVISLPHPNLHPNPFVKQGRRLKRQIKRVLEGLNNMLNAHSSLREYNVTLSSGETMYILAANSEEAAWHALELSETRGEFIKDIKVIHEW